MPTAGWWRAWEVRNTTSAVTTTPTTWTFPVPDDATGGVVWADNSSATWSITSASITSAANYTLPLITYERWIREAQRHAAAMPLAAVLQWQPNPYQEQLMQYAARQIEPARIAADEAARAERTARVAAQTHEHARANNRAEILLREHLTGAQSEELAARGHFHLDAIAPNGERKRYRIRRGRHGNIDQVDAQGKVLKSLCVHPSMQCPDADTMLAQKLWLETNEPELLRVANVVPR